MFHRILNTLPLPRHKAVMAGGVAALVLGSGGALVAQDVPLENQPVRLFTMETAETYSAGTLELKVGTMQTDPNISNATGNQLYFGGGSYAVNDRFSFGIDLSTYEDPVLKPINGSYPPIKMNTAALWGKYRLYMGERVTVSALLSLEDVVQLRSPLWGGDNRGVFVGAAKLPISYRASDTLALHVTPAVSVFPSTLGGSAFYGTIGSLGLGASVKPNPRLTLYGSVDMPVSGGNTLTQSATFKKVPVWTAGARYNVTPKIALEGYVTNGIGSTPATSILTFWPDGDTVLLGAQLVYTPGASRPVSYRGTPAPVTRRQVNLQQDGFTLGRADILEPGTMRLGAWGGADNTLGGIVAFSPDRDAEIQFAWDKYSDNATASALVPGTNMRYMIGGKLRFMDQDNGNPFSLTGRVLYGRQINANPGIGVFFIEGLAGYKMSGGRLTLTAAPKVAGYSKVRVAGLGLGLNYALSESLELIAEATPVAMDASTPTWAAGLRYNFGQSGFAMDAMATNAVGREGIGTMLAQDDVLFSVMLTKTFDLTGLKRW